jgi:hypothetical protein
MQFATSRCWLSRPSQGQDCECIIYVTPPSWTFSSLQSPVNSSHTFCYHVVPVRTRRTSFPSAELTKERHPHKTWHIIFCVMWRRLYFFKQQAAVAQSVHWLTCGLNVRGFDNWTLTGYYAARRGYFVPTFRDNLSVPSSDVKNSSKFFGFLTL